MTFLYGWLYTGQHYIYPDLSRSYSPSSYQFVTVFRNCIEMRNFRILILLGIAIFKQENVFYHQFFFWKMLSCFLCFYFNFLPHRFSVRFLPVFIWFAYVSSKIEIKKNQRKCFEYHSCKNMAYTLVTKFFLQSFNRIK